MRSSTPKIVDYIRQLHRSGHSIFFGLIDLPHSHIPELIEAYYDLTDSRVRATLVEVIGHYRQPETLDFLAEALQENEPEIWQAALDGIVTIGGEAGQAVLIKEITHLSAKEKTDHVRIEWIEEAISQIQLT